MSGPAETGYRIAQPPFHLLPSLHGFDRQFPYIASAFSPPLKFFFSYMYIKEAIILVGCFENNETIISQEFICSSARPRRVHMVCHSATRPYECYLVAIQAYTDVFGLACFCFQRENISSHVGRACGIASAKELRSGLGLGQITSSLLEQMTTLCTTRYDRPGGAHYHSHLLHSFLYSRTTHVLTRRRIFNESRTVQSRGQPAKSFTTQESGAATDVYL